MACGLGGLRVLCRLDMLFHMAGETGVQLVGCGFSSWVVSLLRDVCFSGPD